MALAFYATKGIMQQLIAIDKEFQALIPPLSAEEYAQLEANILADGCRDPLVVWPLPEFAFQWAEDGSDPEVFKYADRQWRTTYSEDEGDGGYEVWKSAIYDEDYLGDDWPLILVDGHNRHEICSRHDLPFDTVIMEFADRDEATEWIIKNQFGRRNLSDYQRGVLALRMKPIIEARAESARLAGNSIGGKSSPNSAATSEQPKIRTDSAVADLANLGKDTIRKIEHIEEVAEPQIKALAASGDVSINLANQFIDLPEEAQQVAIAAIAENSEVAKVVMREAVKNHRAIGTGENEWYTPEEYAEMAREVMGSIDLDPASCEEANKVVKAAAYYTKDDDGLTKDWSGNVWCNPPYSRDLMPAFVEKLRKAYEEGEVNQAILLSHNNTDTAWFHSLAGVATAICFPKKRIKFYRGEEIAAPTNGQAFFYLGNRAECFKDLFCGIGFVVTPA